MKRLIKNPTILVLMSGLLAYAGSPWIGAQDAAAGADVLSLQQAVDMALKENPAIRATAAAQRAAAAGVTEAEAGRLPALQFRETYTNSNNPVFVFGSLLEQGKFGPSNFDPSFLNSPSCLNNFRSGLNLQVPVFDRFQTSAGVEKAKIREGQSQLEGEWVRQQIRLQVIQSYFGFLVATSRKEVAAEAVRSAQSEVDNISAKVDQGLAVSSDLLAMQVQLADFRQQLVQAEGDEKTALAALNTVLARPVDQPLKLVGELAEKEFPLMNQGDFLASAMNSRPDLQSAGRQVDSVRQQVRVAKGQIWPDLNLFANYGFSSEDLASGSADYAIGASLSFNILDFGRSSRIEQAAAGLEGAQAERDRLANQVRFEVVQAYQEFQVAQERLRLASAAVAQATEAMRIVQDRHNVGLTTVTEVLRAQTALLQARLGMLASRYMQYLGYGRVLLATGALKDVSPFLN